MRGALATMTDVDMKVDMEEEELEEIPPYSDIKKLREANIHTIEGVYMTTKKRLCLIKGLTEAKIAKIFGCVNKLRNFGFQTGTEVQKCRDTMVRVSTGSKSLDELLGGGIESIGITEVFGEFRTGKSQLCHTLAVMAQLPSSMGGGNGKVIYIDTEGTFRTERIVSICDRFNVDANAVLENITYARVYTTDHQAEVLQGAAAKMMEETYSMIIVDSATALFRVDFVGRGELAARQNMLGQFLSSLGKLSEVGVLITNQVVSDPGASAMFISDPKKPIGGHIMAHSSVTRLFLRKGKGEQRVCKIYDSPCLPEAECLFQLTEGGINDVQD